MSLLSDVIQIKKSEQETELRDIAAISGAAENFINIRRDTENQARQIELDELFRRNIESQIEARVPTDLQRRNIESQIEARKPSATDLLIEQSDAIDAARNVAKTTGNIAPLNALIGGANDPKNFLDPIVAVDTPSLETQAPLADDFIPPAGDIGMTADIGQGVERDILGDITEVGKVQLGLQKKKAEAEISQDTQVATQELKEGAKVRRNLSSGDLKLDLTLGEFFKFAKEQQDLLGLPAGPLAGSLTKIISLMSSENKNKFLAAFEGSRIELAAFVGRNAMPGTRAARIIDLFRKTTPSPFDTIGSGIRNAAVSWGETIATDFGPNADEYVPGYSKMNVEEQGKARKEILKPYIKEQIKIFEDTYTIEAYKISPEMFTEKDRAVAEKLVRESIRLNIRGK